MSQEITVITPFLKMAAKVWGPKNAKSENTKTLLAIHGWMDNAASFDFIAPLLAEEYRVIAIDLPGHGKSQHRDITASYAFVNWALDVVACCDSLQLEKFSILGHSMGASVACFVAAACPERVENLFLIEGLGPITDPPEKCVTTLRRHIKETIAFTQRKEMVYESTELVIKKRMELNNISREAATVLVNRSMQQVEGGVSWLADPRLRTTSPMRFMEEQIIAVFQEIVCPVVLFRAENGISYDQAKLTKRCEQIKNFQIVKVPGSHHTHMDHPQATANTIMQKKY